MIITKQQIDTALLIMGNRFLKEPWKSKWTPQRPTTGYCYPVSEVLYHYDGGVTLVPYLVDMPEGKHWYLRRLGILEQPVVDMTADQYDTPVPYEKGRRARFITRAPSKRARTLAHLLGVVI